MVLSGISRADAADAAPLQGVSGAVIYYSFDSWENDTTNNFSLQVRAIKDFRSPSGNMGAEGVRSDAENLF